VVPAASTARRSRWRCVVGKLGGEAVGVGEDGLAG
jgi:hypothetical protein